MNRAAFFAAIRPHFGGSLSEPQVQGMEALLHEMRAISDRLIRIETRLEGNGK